MKNLHKLKILYIEDEECIRNNAIEYLSYFSDYIYEALDGIDGYTKYLNIKPDIIICDIIMPNMNGIELIEKIRKTDKSTKIIVATARIDTEFLIKAVELQLVKYVTKPLTDKKLSEALEDAIELIDENKNIIHLSESIVYDSFNKTVFCDNKLIKLTKKELLFLEICVKNNMRATPTKSWKTMFGKGI